MTTWCGLLKGAKMEVNGSRGILRKKIQREIRVRESILPKRNCSKQERSTVMKKRSRKRATGQTTPKESVCIRLLKPVSADGCTFFPVCLPWVMACAIHGASGHLRLSAPAQEKQRKKPSENPVKAPLWHKHKRNGPCVISLKRFHSSQAWRKALFSAYAVVGTRSFKTCFVRWCSDGSIRFYGKSYMQEKENIKYIPFSQRKCVLLHTMSSLKVTQLAEE